MTDTWDPEPIEGTWTEAVRHITRAVEVTDKDERDYHILAAAGIVMHCGGDFTSRPIDFIPEGIARTRLKEAIYYTLSGNWEWAEYALHSAWILLHPPVMCDCGQEDVTRDIVKWGGIKHSKDHCGPCCVHGAWLSERREQCNPPIPRWRQMVDGMDGGPLLRDALGHVLGNLSRLTQRAEPRPLARIVAICEQQGGDGWKADPDRVPEGHWGISWLLVPLSPEPPAWHVLGDRAAAWLRAEVGE